MRIVSILTLSACIVRGDVIIDSATNNGGFVSTTTGFNGSPTGWTAASGVWMDTGNSTLTSAPFGADSTTNSRFIQIHKDTGETLTSNATFTVAAGTTVNLSFDYKTAGSGNNTNLTVTLWDSVANTTFATLGTLSTSTAASSFTQVNYNVTAAAANPNLQLRFTLSTGGKDFHIDRVYLSGGTITPPQPPAAITYDVVQQLLPEDTDARIVEKSAKLLPRPNQVAWQRQETTFFIHYGPNAFNGVEWGTGTESPSIFNPTALDASQWVSEIKNAGGKMIMLVVKHHDGFCLWPSRYTTQSVASSPWLGGTGDLARMVSDECHKAGIRFGVYLSPADLYQIKRSGGYYGNGSSSRLGRALRCGFILLLSIHR
ncbi:MAG: alpha-L-fucosidase [Luteolibacter sp.]